MSDFGIDEDFNKGWEAANKVKPTTATIERLLHEKKELEAENARLKQQVEDHQHQEQLQDMVIERRDEENARMREALAGMVTVFDHPAILEHTFFGEKVMKSVKELLVEYRDG